MEWFIYYWWHEFDLIDEILIEKKKLILQKLRDRLEFEENNYFFLCKNCSNSKIKFNFDEAFELNFKCAECGGEFIKKVISPILLFIFTLGVGKIHGRYE